MDDGTHPGSRDKVTSLSTRAGLVTLIGGSYLLALGLAGLNAATSTGARWLWGLLFVVAVLITGWAVVLPWDGKRKPAAVEVDRDRDRDRDDRM